MKKKISLLGEYTIPFQYNGIDKDVLVVIKAKTIAGQDKKEEVAVEDDAAPSTVSE